LGAEAERLRLFDAVLRLLARLARTGPLLVALDDLHWADRDSLALVRLVGRLTRKHPLLLVGTYRRSGARARARSATARPARLSGA